MASGCIPLCFLIFVLFFQAGSELMNELMSTLMEECAKSSELRNKLYQVNFHTTLKGEAMVGGMFEDLCMGIESMY